MEEFVVLGEGVVKIRKRDRRQVVEEEGGLPKEGQKASGRGGRRAAKRGTEGKW